MRQTDNDKQLNLSNLRAVFQTGHHSTMIFNYYLTWLPFLLRYIPQDWLRRCEDFAQKRHQAVQR